MKGRKFNYISLFSSAGVGCYGFKMEDFECIATNELIEKRMDIQRANNKCKYDTGYITGDITISETKQKIYNEIERWKRLDKIKEVDVIVATPPCQGMSVANFKKKNEIERNSLVCQAVEMIYNIKPRIFVIENVASFIKTPCMDEQDKVYSIGEFINKKLNDDYYIYSKVINFMDYGVPSSRPRTLMIGTRKDMLNVSPLNIFPLAKNQITLNDCIRDLKPLSFGEIDNNDVYHAFREYPRYMEDWLKCIGEGESAYQNPDGLKPYKLVNNQKVLLKSGHLGNKFRRMFWNKPAPCITTRNDQLASQSTIHPTDNRVLSIRELMRVMSIPDSFKWSSKSIDNILDKKLYLKKNELNIRRCIGEAVPTEIMRSVARNIKEMLTFEDSIKDKSIMGIESSDSYYVLAYQEEMKLLDKKNSGSFYTPQSVVFESIKNIKPQNKNLSILEPSVGMGAFIPQLLRLVGELDKVELTLMDINPNVLDQLSRIFHLIGYTKSNLKINFVCDDFLDHKFNEQFDITIANPPYIKPDNDKFISHRSPYSDVKIKNYFGLFMYKCRDLAKENVFIIPKYFLMTPEFDNLRLSLEKTNIVTIIDFGVGFFKNVGLEIISIHFKDNYNGPLYVENKRTHQYYNHKQGYIFHDKSWIIYRDEWFDGYIKTLKLNVFDYYRDRQITNKYLKDDGKIRVLRSKNVKDNGSIVSVSGYDKYLDDISGFKMKDFINRNSIALISFTYNLRAIILPQNCVVNGSFAILKLKDPNDQKFFDLNLYSTDEFKRYYAIVKNDSRYTLNIDANSIYYIGVKHEQ